MLPGTIARCAESIADLPTSIAGVTESFAGSPGSIAACAETIAERAEAIAGRAESFAGRAEGFAESSERLAGGPAARACGFERTERARVAVGSSEQFSNECMEGSYPFTAGAEEAATAQD